MKLQILNSGSVGNCYLLKAQRETLVVECGVRFSDIKQALGFNLTRVAGVLVSHEHQDHCKAHKDVAAAGLNMYASKGTIKALNPTNNSHRYFAMDNLNKYTIGEFTVMPFDVKHDCNEPTGFLIHHSECGNVLFVTDSYYVSYTFKGLNQVMVEANYCPEIVKERAAGGRLHVSVADRVFTSHMSIDTCLDLLAANDLSKVNNIVLLHLSDGNSHAQQFKQRVSAKTGKQVTVADKGVEIDFGLTPF